MIDDRPIEYAYEADGNTKVFPYPTEVEHDSHLLVIAKGADGEREVVTAEKYAVNKVPGSRSKYSYREIEFTEPPEAGTVITIRRRTPLEQPTDFRNQGAYFTETTENTFDKLEMQIQEAYNLAEAADPARVDDVVMDINANIERFEAAAEANRQWLADNQNYVAAMTGNLASAFETAATGIAATANAAVAEVRDYAQAKIAEVEAATGEPMAKIAELANTVAAESAARISADNTLTQQQQYILTGLAGKVDNSVFLSNMMNVTAAIAGKADSVHTHTMGAITGLSAALDGKAAAVHTHAQYATKEELENIQPGGNTPIATYETAGIVKPDGVTVHIEADGTLSAVGGGTGGEGGGTSAHNELTGRNVPDAHPISAVTGLQDALNGKQEAGSYSVTGHGHVISDVSDLQAALSGKQDAGDYAAAEHTHTQYAEAGELTALEQTVQAITDGDITTTPADHTHAMADVETLQDTLDGKAASTHTHQQSDIDGLADALANAGGIAEAPDDGNYYARRSKVWAEIKRKFVCFHPDGGPVFYKYKSSSTSSTARVRVRAGSIINGYEYTSYSSLPTITVSDTSNQGQDFGIFYSNGSFYVKQDNKEAPASETTWGKRIGGFHVGLVPYDATLASAGCNTATSSPLVSMVWTQADLDKVKDINEYSIWDLSYRPKCDPRGMVCVRDSNGKGNFWVDIYFLNNNYYNKGTSRANQPMASGTVLPPMAKIAGGNGTALYTTLNWYEANEIAFDQNKRLMTYDEFCIAAFGVTENQSLGGSGTPEQTKHENGYMSKWGVEQATGHIYTWGRTAHGVSLADASVANAWQENIATRGQVYNKPFAVIFGGARSLAARSGSRCGAWFGVPSNSSWSFGARLACDHLTLGA